MIPYTRMRIEPQGHRLHWVTYLVATLLWLAAFAFLWSCGPKPFHVAVVTDQALYDVLSAVHAGEQTVLCGQPSCANVTARPAGAAWTDAKSQAFNRTLLPAVEAGRQFNVRLAAWKPGTPPPQEIANLITGLSTSLTAVTTDFPEGATKSAILANIGKAQALVLNAVAAFFAVKGT